MPVIQVNATDRFDVISLSTDILNGYASPLHTFYTCPVCKEKISFSRMDFETRGRYNSSNLSAEHALIISDFAGITRIGDCEYLDWYCPECKLPARVYFRQWAGGRHGDSGINIISVIEFQD